MILIILYNTSTDTNTTTSHITDTTNNNTYSVLANLKCKLVYYVY